MPDNQYNKLRNFYIVFVCSLVYSLNKKNKRRCKYSKNFLSESMGKRAIDNHCPMKLCITHNSQRKYYSINDNIKNHKWLFLSIDYIENVAADNLRGKYREITASPIQIILPIFHFTYLKKC